MEINKTTQVGNKYRPRPEATGELEMFMVTQKQELADRSMGGRKRTPKTTYNGVCDCTSVVVEDVLHTFIGCLL